MCAAIASFMQLASYSEYLRIAVAIPGWAHVIALLVTKTFPQLFQVWHSFLSVYF